MKRKYNYDENFFECIDSFEKAYWLGFITADGYIMDNTKKNNKSDCCGLRIRLSIDDKNHLYKFHERLKCNKPILEVKNYGIYSNQKNLCESTIYCRKIVKDLNNIGLTSGNKSTNEKFIILDNDELTKNFILGLFDGDGSITKDINNHTEFSIVSSLEMTNNIRNFLSKKLDISIPKITSNNNGKNLFRIRIFSKDSLNKIFNYFYKENCSQDFLDRKYNKFEEICNL